MLSTGKGGGRGGGYVWAGFGRSSHRESTGGHYQGSGRYPVTKARRVQYRGGGGGGGAQGAGGSML